MTGGDADFALAFYMFVNHGWSPGQVTELSEKERLLMLYMADKEIKSRPKSKNK